jgi:hypothetical protein
VPEHARTTDWARLIVGCLFAAVFVIACLYFLFGRSGLGPCLPSLTCTSDKPMTSLQLATRVGQMAVVLLASSAAFAIGEYLVRAVRGETNQPARTPTIVTPRGEAVAPISSVSSAPSPLQAAAAQATAAAVTPPQGETDPALLETHRDVKSRLEAATAILAMAKSGQGASPDDMAGLIEEGLRRLLMTHPEDRLVAVLKEEDVLEPAVLLLTELKERGMLAPQAAELLRVVRAATRLGDAANGQRKIAKS